MKKILTVLAFLYAISPIYAQLIEGNPCTATCIDPSGIITGRQPNQNNVSPNQNLPCGSGTTEDNPAWWIVRPSGNSLTFTVTTTNCVAGGCDIGVQMTLWEGDNCGSVTAIDCVVGTSGTFTSSVTPCKVYYLQVDGLCECQCNVTLTYDKNQILKSVPKPEITGPKTACVGATLKLCASIPSLPGCIPDGYTWRIDPLSAATVSPISGEPDCANIKINSIPPSGKIKVCAKPKFNGKCPPTVQEECFEIEIINLKPATCDITICPEQRPYDYDLKKCIKTTNPTFNDSLVSNNFYLINQLPGTNKQQKITYTAASNGCQGEVNLNINVLDNKPSQIPPVILCSGDSLVVKGNLFKCNDAGAAIKKFQKLGSPKPLQCDSTYEVLVQCIKINPVITGATNFDCNIKKVTLRADVSSLTLPNSINLTTYTGVGTRAYQWYKNNEIISGANTPSLEVTEIGNYSVKLTYSYEITMIINGTEGKWSKSCSKTETVEIKDLSGTVTAVVTSNSPVCEGKTAMLTATGGTSYKWSGPDNFNSMLANPTIPNIQAKNAGLYSVEVTNADNCKGTATTNLVVENCISSNDITNKNIQIYPNPFTHQLNIDADEIMDKIMIYNTLGQIILEQHCQSSKVSLDVSTLPSAHYNLKIKWANGKNSEYRVIKQ